MTPSSREIDARVEAVAAECHKQWAGWMNHVFSKAPGRNFSILPEFVTRWKIQMDTPYADLSEPEKESDRIEARKILAALAALEKKDA